MAKKKTQKQGGSQQFLSPDEFMRQRMRQLPIGKCYITHGLEAAGVQHIIVTRRHTGGRISMAFYLVDFYCTGLKDSFYRLRMEDYELKENYLDGSELISYKECSYEEAHNRIYGAIAFAQEAGIKPDSSFAITKYMLEEDTDDVPLIEYDFGRLGRHCLYSASALEASRYLPLLRKNLGEGNFDFMITDDDNDDNDDDDDEGEFNRHHPTDQPLTVEMLVNEADVKQLRYNAPLLTDNIDADQDADELRRAYSRYVLENPMTVLRRLPTEELSVLQMLQYLRENDQKLPGDNTVPTMFNYLEPILERLRLAETFWDDEDYYHIRIADDFADAALPCLEQLKDDELNKMRLLLESIAEGMTNLYGVVTLSDIKARLKPLVDGAEDDEDGFNDIISYTMSTSPLMVTMATLADYPPADPDEHVPDDKVYFLSRYGWENIKDMLRYLQQHDDPGTPQRTFNNDQVLMATSSPLPIIPNDVEDEFTRFLTKKLKYNDNEARYHCFNLWYRLQNEDNPDFSEESYTEYFNNIIIGGACKQPTRKTISEATALLQRYINAMPRWTLGGHALKDTL